LQFWGLASIAIRLDQEEESVPEEFKELPVQTKAIEEADPSELPVLLKKVFQVTVICCGL
jgi:hypothetical protein